MELFTDSPPPSNPWIELYQLAEHAGVSVEHLCAAVEIASLHQKLASPIHSALSAENDLDTVVRLLTDDAFPSTAKAGWNEALHPRDDTGRFSNGQINIPLTRWPTNQETSLVSGEIKAIHGALQTL